MHPYGIRKAAYGAVDNRVYESIRHFLRGRHQVHSRGTHRISVNAVFGELGLPPVSKRVNYEAFAEGL